MDITNSIAEEFLEAECKPTNVFYRLDQEALLRACVRQGRAFKHPATIMPPPLRVVLDAHH